MEKVYRLINECVVCGNDFKTNSCQQYVCSHECIENFVKENPDSPVVNDTHCLEYVARLAHPKASYFYPYIHGFGLSYVVSFNTKNQKREKGQVIRHMCDNNRCMNANHLELGTVYDNTRDYNERGKFRPKFKRLAIEKVSPIFKEKIPRK